MQAPVQNPDFNGNLFFQTQFAPSSFILNSLSNADLMKLMKSNKEVNNQIQMHLHALFNPFFTSGLFRDTRFNRPVSSEKYKFTLEQTRLVLVRAISFSPELVLTCVKLFPELMTSVLETREVTVKYPLNNVCFTSQWHFKLPHLIARYGSVLAKDTLYDHFSHEKNPQEAQGKFFSEPICWETKDSKGNQGPTPIFIAILHQQAYFASEIANHNTTFILKESGFDEPFQKINPFYIALENAKTQSSRNSFHALIKQYHSPFIHDCVDIAIIKASKGEDTLLKILLESPSNNLSSNLEATPKPLFHLIDTNNLPLLRLVCIQIEHFTFIEQDMKPLLYAATERALQDKAYLPMVRHFLCCGCETTFHRATGRSSPSTLVESNFGEAFLSVFHDPTPHKKTIAKYFKIADLFSSVVKFCAIKNVFMQLESDLAKQATTPEITLLTCAQLDVEFFNELVVSFFVTPDEGWMLNKTLNHFEDRMHYFECLFKFASLHDGTTYLTAKTLEKIGDAILDYRKQSRSNLPTHKDPALKYALFMYGSAMNKVEEGSEYHQRFQAKYSILCKIFENVSDSNMPSYQTQ